MALPKKWITVFALVLLIGGLAGCPLLAPSWVQHVGENDGDDGAYAIAKSADGGYVVAGWSETEHAVDDNVQLAKLNKWGMTLWQRSYGDEREDRARAVAPTTDGGFIIAGAFGYKQEDSDAFLLKVNAQGSEQWRRVVDGDGYDEAVSVEPTSDGGYIACLVMDGMNEGVAVLLKTDASGQEAWRLTSPAGVHAVEAVPTTDGGYAMAWWRLPDRDKARPQEGEVTLVKTDAAGSELWRKSLASERAVHMVHLIATQDGGFALAGQIDFMAQDSQACLWKTDGAGALQWQQIYGVDGREVLHAVRELPGGGFVMAGEISAVSAKPHAYLIKTNAFGSVLWERAFGGDDFDLAYDVTVGQDDTFCLAGVSHSSEKDGEPDHSEMFVVKTDRYGHCKQGETEMPQYADSAPAHYDLTTLFGTSHTLAPHPTQPQKVLLTLVGLHGRILSHRVLNSDEIQEEVQQVRDLGAVAQFLGMWEDLNYDQNPPEAALLVGSTGSNPHYQFMRLTEPAYDSANQSMSFTAELLPQAGARELGLLDDDIVPSWQKSGGSYVFMESNAPIFVDDTTWQEEVVASDLPVLVEFWAQWSGPSRLMAAILDDVAQEFGGRVKVVKVDVDNAPVTTSQQGVFSIPTMVLYVDGQMRDRLVGAVPRTYVDKFIERNI